MTTKSIADLSADNAVLISEISRLPRGSTVTYTGEFSGWLRRAIRCRADMPNFSTVERRLRADYDITLSVVKGIGYKILSHADTVSNDARIDRSRRQARLRKEELATVDLSGLGDQEKLTYAGKMAQAHLIEETGRDRSLKRLVKAANGDTPLSLGHALEALKRNL